MNISKEDYLKLLQEISSEEEYEVPNTYYSESAWIPAESPLKDKIKKAAMNGVIDVMGFKKDQIQDAIYKCSTLKANAFTIKINEYHGLPGKNIDPSTLTLDISVWETHYKTPSGAPCKMEYRMNFFKDDRFANRPWLSYFGPSGSAHNIPTKTVVDIVKWIQAVQKLSAFL